MKSIYEYALVTNVDKRMIGKNLCGFEFKESLFNNPNLLQGNKNTISSLYEKFGIETCEYYQYENRENYKIASSYFYIEKKMESPLDMLCFIDAIRLFSNNGFAYARPLYQDEEGMTPGIVKINYWETNNENENELFYVCDKCRVEFEKLYQAIKCNDKKTKLAKMLEVYRESFRAHTYAVKFLLRTTVLEMLLGKNSELTNRLARTYAVLLGKDDKESNDIYKNLKDLYNVRSKIVHQGEFAIDMNDFKLLTKYVRSALLLLVEKNIDTNKIEEKLNTMAFGSNPYNVGE